LGRRVETNKKDARAMSKTGVVSPEILVDLGIDKMVRVMSAVTLIHMRR
jgi:hypothetical protein